MARKWLRIANAIPLALLRAVRTSYHSKRAAGFLNRHEDARAVPHLTATEALFRAAGLEALAGRYAFKAGKALCRLGRYQESVDRLEVARASLSEGGGLDPDPADWAMTLGVALRSLDRPEEALEYLEEASRLFEARGDRPGRARCDVNRANLLADIGRGADAADLYMDAHVELEAAGLADEVAWCDMNYAALVLGNWQFDEDNELGLDRHEVAVPVLRKAQQHFTERGDAESGALCDASLAQALVQSGEPEEGLRLIERARRYFEARGETSRLASCDLVASQAFRTLDRIDEARALQSRAREAFVATGMVRGVAYCDLNLAILSADRDEALVGALQAIDGLEATRYALSRPEHRHARVMQHVDAYGVALDAAFERSHWELVAELVELSRVQGLPSREGRHKPESSGSGPAADARAVALAAAGVAPLDRPVGLELFAGGRSRFGEMVGRATAPPTCLETAARAAAGDSWLWWGTSVVRGMLYWSLVAHDGTVEAGRVPLEEVAVLLEALDAAIPNLMEGETRHGRNKRLYDSALDAPDLEASFSLDLGRELIPPALRHRLLAVSPDAPVPLVVAPAAILGRVPFGLLRIDDGAAPVRVAQRASVRLAVPVPLMEHVAQREPRPRRPGAMLALLDPGWDGPEERADDDESTGTLAFLGSGARPAEVLSRPAHHDVLEADGIPCATSTKAAFSRRLIRDRPGTVIYVGHAADGGVDAPTAAALQLRDEAPFTAGEWLYEPERYPAPPRLGLVACSSSGSRSTEWLGLTPAALWAGASTVISSSWDLPNQPATWKLAGLVAQLLDTSTDPAAALRALFLECLHRWERGDGSLGTPLVWAGLQIVGAVDG